MGPDRVLGFSRSQGDRIDLSALDAKTGTAGDDAFVALGAGSAGPAGTLRYAVLGSYTLIRAFTDDVEGADFAVIVDGIGAPQLGDFVL